MSYDDDLDQAHEAQEDALYARAAVGKLIYCPRCGLTLYGGRHVCLPSNTRTGPSICGNGDETDDLDAQENAGRPYQLVSLAVAGIIAGVAIAAAVVVFIVLIVENLL